MKFAFLVLGLIFSTAAMAAEPLTIGNTQWFGGTYDCDGGIQVTIQSVDLPAIPNPMFLIQIKANNPKMQHFFGSWNFRRTVSGSNLPNGNLSIAGRFIVEPSFDGKLTIPELAGTNPLNCKQVKFQFPLQ